MDDLVDAFAGHQVTFRPNSTAAEHPHFSLYKAKSSASGQEERRRKFLEAQKNKRFDYVSYARRLATNDWSSDYEEDEAEESEDMDMSEYTPRTPRSYKDQLMLSEWLVELPHDLADEWYLTLCPVGKRCLVVSSRGSTKVYTKSGYQLMNFQSMLPGGSRVGSRSSSNMYSLLDCIYNDVNKTFYILDSMCWNSYPYYDSETEFRFYWLREKMSEVSGLDEISKDNPYKFILLPYYKCDIQSIKEVMWSPLPFPAKLDGLLFYHKRTHYIAGQTPLVGWLKAFMLPQMLSIDVPDELTADRPASYTTMQNHIPEAFEKHARRKEKDENDMQFEQD